MKNLFILFIALFALNNLSYAVELTKDNPDTLIGKNSKEFSVFGVKLGMSHKEAKLALQKDNRLFAKVDNYNPSRLYVYDKKDKRAILYLIWDPGSETLSQITIFSDSRIFLTDNFKRLLSFEVLDKDSKFKKKFIGYHTKRYASFDLPSIEAKDIAYLYEDLGIEITHRKVKDEEMVVFGLKQ